MTAPQRGVDKKVVGRRLKVRRVRSGLSVTAVARELDVSFWTVYRWEAGKSLPGTELLDKAAQLYGTTTRWLLSKPRPGEEEE